MLGWREGVAEVKQEREIELFQQQLALAFENQAVEKLKRGFGLLTGDGLKRAVLSGWRGVVEDEVSIMFYMRRWWKNTEYHP